MESSERKRLVEPQVTAGVSEYEAQLREVNGDLVEQQRVGVAQPGAREHGYTGVEHHRQSGLLRQAVERVQAGVVRRDRQVTRVDLHATETVAVHQPADRPSQVPVEVGVWRAEWHKRVDVGAELADEFIAGDTSCQWRYLREHDGAVDSLALEEAGELVRLDLLIAGDFFESFVQQAALFQWLDTGGIHFPGGKQVGVEVDDRHRPSENSCSV